MSGSQAATDAGLDLLSRYQYNGGKPDSSVKKDWGVTNATAIVGSYLPNAWGIYDMHGNVRELCLDLYSDNITALNGAVNTAATGSTTNCVMRGGSWNDPAGTCRSAYRESRPPVQRGYHIGFRVACTAGLE